MSMYIKLYNKETKTCWQDINLWLSTLKPNSVKNYVSSIKKFCKFLNVEPGINDDRLFAVNSDIITAWIQNLRFKDSTELTNGDAVAPRSSDATVYRHFSSIRKMYRVLLHKGYLNKNPFDDPLLPRISQNNMRFTHALTSKEIDKVIAHLVTVDNYSQLAFFLLSICCAMRKSEVRALKIKDIENRDGRWVINIWQEKTSSPRTCPLPDLCEKHLGYWLDAQKSYRPDSSWLFVTKDGVQYSEQGIGRDLVRTFRKLGILDKTCHSLRATGITLALKNGASKDDIKLLSGHKSSAMVDVYDKRVREESENPSLLINW